MSSLYFYFEQNITILNSLFFYCILALSSGLRAGLALLVHLYIGKSQGRLRWFLIDLRSAFDKKIWIPSFSGFVDFCRIVRSPFPTSFIVLRWSRSAMLLPISTHAGNMSNGLIAIIPFLQVLYSAIFLILMPETIAKQFVVVEIARQLSQPIASHTIHSADQLGAVSLRTSAPES